MRGGRRKDIWDMELRRLKESLLDKSGLFHVKRDYCCCFLVRDFFFVN